MQQKQRLALECTSVAHLTLLRAKLNRLTHTHKYTTRWTEREWKKNKLIYWIEQAKEREFFQVLRNQKLNNKKEKEREKIVALLWVFLPFFSFDLWRALINDTLVRLFSLPYQITVFLSLCALFFVRNVEKRFFLLSLLLYCCLLLFRCCRQKLTKSSFRQRFATIWKRLTSSE